MRANCEPMAERLCITCEKRMQDERGKREVVHPIHLTRDFQLLHVVTVNLYEDFDSLRMGVRGERFDEAKRLRNHETACPWLLDGISDRIEPYSANSCMPKIVENGLEVRFALRVLYINVDLLGSERRPKKMSFAVFQWDVREGQAGTRPIDAKEILLVCT